MLTHSVAHTPLAYKLRLCNTVDMKLNLPKGYLSYSSITLWQTNKDQYRKKYYYGQESHDTTETLYGKHIAKLLENNSPLLAHIPRYPVSEHPLEIEINGVPIKGYLDSFDPERLAFQEYKTGHLSRHNGPPWTKIKVAKHEQLPFYSLMIKTKYGRVDPWCDLIWIETQFAKQEIEFEGHTLSSLTRDLELTGRVEIFRRRIAQWERDRIRKWISTCAEEISNDYTQWMKTK